ncbi:MAG TPA: hypothetical protein VF823_13460 [Anaerolineales bacterium]
MKRSWQSSLRKIVILISSLAILLSGCITSPGSPQATSPAGTAPAVTAPAPGQGAPGPLPDLKTKPTPKEITFQGCPPEGDGGDPVLNRNKNRVDEASYYPVTFDAMIQLTWPKATERRDHNNWSAADAAAIAKYEGIPVEVEGYLAGVKQSGPESCNCHGADPQFEDWHIWLTKTAGEDRTHSIVVETTPRVRANHPAWTLPAVEQLVKDQTHVRISGWTMFDPEHPDQIDKTRGTIWEIHPIMKIEVEKNGKWVSLDDLSK